VTVVSVADSGDECDDGVRHSSGQELQRMSVITSLPRLLKDSHAECMRRIVPKITV